MENGITIELDESESVAPVAIVNDLDAGLDDIDDGFEILEGVLIPSGGNNASAQESVQFNSKWLILDPDSKQALQHITAVTFVDHNFFPFDVPLSYQLVWICS